MNLALLTNRLGFEAMKDISSESTFDCICGWTYLEGKEEICSVCGKKMCPRCKERHGNLDSDVCFRSKDLRTLRISDDGVLTTIAIDGKLYG